MGILSRISKVLESNVNALIEKAEDPAKMLDQAIADMKRGQGEAQEALIEAKTELRLIDKRREKAEAEGSELERRAMKALEAGDDALARRYVEQKLSADERVDAERNAGAEHEAQITQLDAAAKELDRRLQQMPAKRAALMARKSAAEARGGHTGAASKASSAVSDALQAFDRMEEKIIRAEVEAEVRGTGDPLMLDAGPIEDMKADDALAALKAKMAAQIEPPPSEPEADAEPSAVDDTLADLKARLEK